MAETGAGHYVYCVMPGDAQPSLDDVVSVDARHAVEVLRHAGLAALVGRVSLAEFGSEPLKRNLNDLDWLARAARAHQGVLDRAFASGPIVPLRLCTIYADEAHVRGMLEREHDVLLDTLARLRDRSEWGAKLIVDARHEADRESSAPASGREYLLGRSRERQARQDAQAITRQAAEEVHEGLRRQSTAATLLPPQSRELYRGEGAMILNGAYLVERSAVERFRAVAEELRARQHEHGLALEITGPWPPYNFVESQER
jgi:gas vesicle protein GvpL/GvpF